MIRSASRRARSRIAGATSRSATITSASCSARIALKVSRSGSPGPAPTSVTRPISGAVPGELALDQVGGTVEVAGEIGPRDRPVEEAVPEPAPGAASRDGCGRALAQAGGPAGEPAQARRQHRLEPRLDLPREDRCCALGADRHHHRIAVDDGRRDEVAQLLPVDGVDRHAGRPRHRHRARRFGIVLERHIGQPHAGEVARRQRPRLQRDGARGGQAGDLGARLLAPARGCAPWSWPEAGSSAPPARRRRRPARADDPGPGTPGRSASVVQHSSKCENRDTTAVRRMIVFHTTKSSDGQKYS